MTRLSASLHGIDADIYFRINALRSDLGNPDPLVRVNTVPLLGDLGAAAQEATHRFS